MSLKDEFLRIETYEEYESRRDDFHVLDWSDKENIEHLSQLFSIKPKGDNEDNVHVDYFYTAPRKG